ncbi:hypothetical protein SC499_12030 [Peribacillus simplex]|uniref:hypothetical protein n=1 Tax=Peribacillus TaxID=2675229 RepID=UPI002952B6C1|nr:MULTISPECIES: hypothetical protein [Peribacillus]MDV7763015.1 hypothetical protein [Peribacillus sp. CSMR9]MDW7615430.1 hypothetical protein [Peribacillus simplex]
MWELLLEFDYQTVRHAVWAGYLLTFVFPLAAFYFLNKKQSLLNDKYQASIHSDKSKSPVQACSIFDWRGAQRFFTFIRQKQKDSLDDSDEPSLLIVV